VEGFTSGITGLSLSSATSVLCGGLLVVGIGFGKVASLKLSSQELFV
jgi:hypothetical protein